jgi:hypothetical protein
MWSAFFSDDVLAAPLNGITVAINNAHDLPRLPIS